MMYLFYGLGALKVWMLVDAIQRGVAGYWYCVIAFVPFGSVAYFLMVKAPELGLGPGWSRYRPVSRGHGAVDLAAIRHRFRENPCLANEALLASALYDAGEYAEAEAHYRGVLARDDRYQRALYGLGLCQVAQGNHTAAVELLRKLLDQDRSYADYGAWLELAGSLAALGETEKAVECLEGLHTACPRLDHSVALAEALLEAERPDEARARLERALLDYEHAPRHVRRQSGAAARRARQLLGALPATA